MKMGTEVNKEIEREIKIIITNHERKTSNMKRIKIKNKTRTIITRGTIDSSKMDNK